MFPTPNPPTTLDPRMQKLVAYAKKAEADIYEAANSRMEYYELVTETMHNLQKKCGNFLHFSFILHF